MNLAQAAELLFNDHQLAPRTRVQQLCSLCVDVLGVTGAAVSVADGMGTMSSVCGSDKVSVRLEELQLELAEGPTADSMRTHRPVLAPYLSDAADKRWLWFAPAATQVGAGGVFVQPLSVCADRAGALSVYRDASGGLTGQQYSDWQQLAAVATSILLSWDPQHRAHPPDSSACDQSGSPTELYQAVGITMEQLKLDGRDALDLLRAHAYSTEQTLAHVATDVVSGDLRPVVD